ncbi:MAG: DUF1043 family protein [Ferrimonas sp.]
MNEVLIIIAALVGGVGGFLLGKRPWSNSPNIERLQAELTQARFDLEQQRLGIHDYFTQSKEQLNALTGQLAKIQALWQESAQELITDIEPESSTKTAEADAATVETASADQSLPPNDYAQGSHGIINKA